MNKYRCECTYERITHSTSYYDADNTMDALTQSINMDYDENLRQIKVYTVDENIPFENCLLLTVQFK